MRMVRLLHRWTGGVIGVLLAAMGLSGAILAWKDHWISVPGANLTASGTPQQLARATEAILADGQRTEAIVFASESFGLHHIYRKEDAGAYADASGRIVESWTSIWARPELWLFDFHHHLLVGEAGSIAAGILALIGIGFIATGTILWWRTRRTFSMRIWPKRMTQSAIVRHHRDLGIMLSPLLFLTCLTGAMLTLKPVAALLLSPFSGPREMEQALAPPKGDFRTANDIVNWAAILDHAQARFPEAELRVVRPAKSRDDPVVVRMKQPSEWLTNGRTMLWFKGDGTLVGARDAQDLPQGLRIFNSVYPIHAGKIGGMVWTIAITLAGLGLSILGLLSSWSFWRNLCSSPQG